MFFYPFKRKKKVLILWYPVDSNLGDYYLYDTVRNFVIKWGYDAIDMDVGASYEIIAEAALKCDWVWFAGGGIIERGVPSIVSNFSEFWKRSNRVRYGVTGLSIGDFDYTNVAHELSEWVNNASFFYTRDYYSACFLNEVSKSNKVISSADVVFSFNGFNKHYESRNRVFGVNFRKMPYPDLTGEIDVTDWDKYICESISEQIICIPDQLDLSKEFRFGNKNRYTPLNAVKKIEQMSYGIAMRYHVVLISALMGKVCIPIDYCPKVTRLAEQLGIEELVLHYDQAEQFPRVLKLYNDNESFFKNVINEKVSELKLKSETMFNTVEIIMKE